MSTRLCNGETKGFGIYVSDAGAGPFGTQSCRRVGRSGTGKRWLWQIVLLPIRGPGYGHLFSGTIIQSVWLC